MNIHEYQGKSILAQFGVAIQRGYVAATPSEARDVASKLKTETGTGWFVVKAQIHAGGRGKGTVTETGSRGVVLAKSLDEVPEKAEAILGGHLVTLQTKAEGKKVSKVYIAEDVYGPGASEPREFYMSILLDRALGRNVIVYSPDGGMNIEDVAHNTPERIFKEVIDPLTGVNDFQCRKIVCCICRMRCRHVRNKSGAKNKR
jgi:succinyl-CoA synthetase beta subunit